MTIAELVANITFKVEGADQLKAFDEQMKSLADSTRDVVSSLKQLAAIKLPEGLKNFVAPTKNVPRGTTPLPGTQPQPVPVSPVTPGNQPLPPLVPPSVIKPKPQIILPPGGYFGKPPPIPGNRAFIGPILPKPKPQKPPTSVTMGLASLSKIALAFVGVGSLVGLLKGLISGIKEMVANSRQQVLATEKLSNQTGLSRRDIRGIERVGSLGGMNREDVDAVLSGLASRAKETQLTGAHSGAYGAARVNPYLNPLEQLLQFHNNFKNTSLQTEQTFGQGLGITPDMVYSLRKYGDELDKIFKNAELTDQQQANVLKLNEAWQTMTFNAGILADKITSDLAPALESIVKVISKVEEFLGKKDSVRSVLNHPQVAATVAAYAAPKVAKAGFHALINASPYSMGAEAIMSMIHALMPRPEPKGDNSTKIEQNIDVNVTGSDKPQETADRTEKGVKRALKDSYYGRPQYQP